MCYYVAMIIIDCDLPTFIKENIPLGNNHPLTYEDEAYTPVMFTEHPMEELVICEAQHLA